MVECFSENAIAELGTGTLQGKQAIVQSLKKNLTESTITFHQGQNFEMAMTGDMSFAGGSPGRVPGPSDWHPSQ